MEATEPKVSTEAVQLKTVMYHAETSNRHVKTKGFPLPSDTGDITDLKPVQEATPSTPASKTHRSNPMLAVSACYTGKLILSCPCRTTDTSRGTERLLKIHFHYIFKHKQ